MVVPANCEGLELKGSMESVVVLLVLEPEVGLLDHELGIWIGDIDDLEDEFGERNERIENDVFNDGVESFLCALDTVVEVEAL